MRKNLEIFVTMCALLWGGFSMGFSTACVILLLVMSVWLIPVFPAIGIFSTLMLSSAILYVIYRLFRL